MLLRNLRLIDGTGAVQPQVDVRIREGRFAEIGGELAEDGEQVVRSDGHDGRSRG